MTEETLIAIKARQKMVELHIAVTKLEDKVIELELKLDEQGKLIVAISPPLE